MCLLLMLTPYHLGNHLNINFALEIYWFLNISQTKVFAPLTSEKKKKMRLALKLYQVIDFFLIKFKVIFKHTNFLNYFLKSSNF